jgi:hypothetical protein
MFPRNGGYDPRHLSPLVHAILSTTVAASPPTERQPRERYDRCSTSPAYSPSPKSSSQLSPRCNDAEDPDMFIHVEQSDVTVDDVLLAGWKPDMHSISLHQSRRVASDDDQWHRDSRSFAAASASPPSSRWYTLEPVVVHPAPTSAAASRMVIASHDVSAVTIPLSSVEAVSFVDAEAWESGDESSAIEHQDVIGPDDGNHRRGHAQQGRVARLAKTAPATSGLAGEEVDEVTHRRAHHVTTENAPPHGGLGLPPRSPPPSHSVSLISAIDAEVDEVHFHSTEQSLEPQHVRATSASSSVSPVSDTTDGSPLQLHQVHVSHVYSFSDDDNTAVVAPHDQSFEAEALSRRLANLRAEVDHMCFAVFLEASSTPSVDAQCAPRRNSHGLQPPSPLAKTVAPSAVRSPRHRLKKTGSLPLKGSAPMPSSTMRTIDRGSLLKPSLKAAASGTTNRNAHSTTGERRSSARQQLEDINGTTDDRSHLLRSTSPTHQPKMVSHTATSGYSISAPLPPIIDNADDQNSHARSPDDVSFFSSYVKSEKCPSQYRIAEALRHEVQQGNSMTSRPSVPQLVGDQSIVAAAGSTEKLLGALCRQPLQASKMLLKRGTLVSPKGVNSNTNTAQVITTTQAVNTLSQRPSSDAASAARDRQQQRQTPQQMTPSSHVSIHISNHAKGPLSVTSSERSSPPLHLGHRDKGSSGESGLSEILWTPVKRQDALPLPMPTLTQPVQRQQQVQKHLRAPRANSLQAAAALHPTLPTGAAPTTPLSTVTCQETSQPVECHHSAVLHFPEGRMAVGPSPVAKQDHHGKESNNEGLDVIIPHINTFYDHSPGVHSANSSIAFFERSPSQQSSFAAASTTAPTRAQDLVNQCEATPRSRVVEGLKQPEAAGSEVPQQRFGCTSDAPHSSSTTSEINFELFSSDDDEVVISIEKGALQHN